MRKSRRYCGFSLVEVLLAVGTLAIGMIFIGGTFLVGIHFSGVSAERTTAVIVANEAFAKIKIFRVDPADTTCGIGWQTPFETLMNLPPGFAVGMGTETIDPNELAYPSTWTLADKQYFWSALCRRHPSDPNNTLQVTVFVSRKVGAGTMYRDPSDPLGSVIDRPAALKVGVSFVAVDSAGHPVLAIDPGMERWIGPGHTIVEDSTGAVYRVVGNGVGPDEINLDPAKPWPWPGSRVVWVVPPPIGRGKGPCIEVYQGEVSF